MKWGALRGIALDVCFMEKRCLSTALEEHQEQGEGGQEACLQMAVQHTQRGAQRGSFELRETEANPGAPVQVI